MRTYVTIGAMVLAIWLQACGGSAHKTTAQTGGASAAESNSAQANMDAGSGAAASGSAAAPGAAASTGAHGQSAHGSSSRGKDGAFKTNDRSSSSNRGRSGSGSGSQSSASGGKSGKSSPHGHGHGSGAANGKPGAARGKPGAAGGKPGAAGGKPGAAGGANVGSSGSGHAPGSGAGIPYKVSTTSMEPTFKPFTTIYYDPTRTRPAIGDVVLFYYPKGVVEGTCGNNPPPKAACQDPEPGLTKQIGIKRVVGLQGERVGMDKGQLYRNGSLLSEPYVTPCELRSECEFPNPITVPTNDYYVLSDNRSLYQEDSRTFGAVPQPAILGTVEHT
jgi:signal peptidase I